MTTEQLEKFIQSAEAAEIEFYTFDVDDGEKLVNDGKRAILKVSGDDVINICSSQFGSGSHSMFGRNSIMVTASDPGDIHKARIGGNYDQIKTFLENYGTSLDDDDLKIMLAINNKNYDVKPATGDYVHGFHYLSDKDYESLSPEEKERYDADKKAYEKAKHDYIGKNQAASITL